eukprot:TRINITY_DN10605_c0_g1_i3.p1 TRINITY_DN10605_c0_g1~~TRINITY_DN10605_c0_g1_i3.p1  ORF type:complete len:647 (+),score=103.59 TRINITY_DN10605_c0_g1_i3:301-2241(+)
MYQIGIKMVEKRHGTGSDSLTGKDQVELNNTISFRMAAREFYSNNTKVLVDIEDLANLVERGIIDEGQALIIWEYLLNGANQGGSFRKQLSHVIGNLAEYLKRLVGSFLFTLIVFGATLIVILFFSIFSIVLASRRDVTTFILYNAIFLFLFHFVGFNIANSIGSSVYNTLICYSTLASYLSLGCGILNLVGLIDLQPNILSCFDSSTSFVGKIILGTYLIGVNYIFAVDGENQFNQYPFFFAIAYLVFILAHKLQNHMFSLIQPFSHFMTSVLGLLLILYSYLFKEECFKHNLNDLTFLRFFINPEHFNQANFSSTCLVIGGFLFLANYAIVAFTQFSDLGQGFQTTEFQLFQVWRAFKEFMSKESADISFSGKGAFMLFYTFLCGLLAFVALRMKNNLLLSIAVFSMECFLGLISKTKSDLIRILYYIAGFFCLNCSFFVGKLSERNYNKGQFTDSIVITSIEILTKLFLSYFALDICSIKFAEKAKIDVGLGGKGRNRQSRGQSGSNNSKDSKNSESERERDKEQEEVNIDILRKQNLLLFLCKFLTNYIIGVYLVILSEDEEYQIVSFFYSLASVTFFCKILVYSTQSGQELQKVLIAVAVYLTGMRISVLSGKILSPFYFGVLLMNFSTCLLYTSPSPRDS